MVLKTWLAAVAGLVFGALVVYDVFLGGGVDQMTALSAGLALLAFAEAAGAFDHETLEAAEVRRAAERTEARRGADRERPGA